MNRKLDGNISFFWTNPNLSMSAMLLRVYMEIVIWITHTFDTNLGIMIHFRKIVELQVKCSYLFSSSNIILTRRLLKRVHQIGQADFSCCVY